MSEVFQEDPKSPFGLQQIDLTIKRGSFVCIYGRVGSGKTALLEALLGEMRQTSGHVVFSGSVSLMTQTPWIQSSTLKDNILFGKPMVKDKFEQVIDACALRQDVSHMPDGIETEIGERGINLSGGQKSRVALARAAYADAEVILLDDPLSAVDSHVSAHLIQHCLSSLLQHKTLILVAHQVEVAQQADLVLVMDNGRILQQGTYAALKNSSGLFRDLVSECANVQSRSTESTAGSLFDKQEDVSTTQNRSIADPFSGTLSNVGPPTQVHISEEINTGAVSYKAYLAYSHMLSRGGPLTLTMTSVTLTEGVTVALTLILGLWAHSSITIFSQGQYMGLYAGLGTAIAFFAFAGSYGLSICGLGASYMMTQREVTSVLRAAVLFHDKTPSGRIVSRLTGDVESLDQRLPDHLQACIGRVLAIVGMICLILYSYAYLGILFVPMIALYCLIGCFYSRTSLQIRRLHSTSRSHVYSAFGEQLSAVVTIRAWTLQSMFTKRLHDALDNYGRFGYLIHAQRLWLTLRLDLLGVALILSIGIFGVCFRNKVSPAKLAVVLTYSLRSVELFSTLIFVYARLEAEMNSCERVLHYGQLQAEAPAKKVNDPDEAYAWPALGEVMFENVHLRYRKDLPPVLKDLSFRASPGERIGIVGRTGAGKSSCLQALLRLVELSSGKITVDGVDLATLGLDTLRHRLSAIPQDPLLFSGTMRTNLDPEGSKTDLELHEALERCGLISHSEKDDERFAKFKLDGSVADEGKNFSGGDRQLVALCRALVKGCKVLIMDEATSSVDPETDAMIQNTIRQHFNHVTILCIAHRLETVAFYDRILVLDQGNLVESGSPLCLFDRSDSVFRSMCQAARLERKHILKLGEECSI